MSLSSLELCQDRELDPIPHWRERRERCIWLQSKQQWRKEGDTGFTCLSHSGVRNWQLASWSKPTYLFIRAVFPLQTVKMNNRGGAILKAYVPYFPHVGCSEESLALRSLHGRLEHLGHTVLCVGGVVITVHCQSDVVLDHLLQRQGTLLPACQYQYLFKTINNLCYNTPEVEKY